LVQPSISMWTSPGGQSGSVCRSAQPLRVMYVHWSGHGATVDTRCAGAIVHWSGLTRRSGAIATAAAALPAAHTAAGLTLAAAAHVAAAHAAALEAALRRSGELRRRRVVHVSDLLEKKN
jgi:hypothetical protein